jgi:hypothetical protein
LLKVNCLHLSLLLNIQFNFPHLHNLLICQDSISFSDHIKVIILIGGFGLGRCIFSLYTVTFKHRFHIVTVQFAKVLSILQSKINQQWITALAFLLLVLLSLLLDDFLFFNYPLSELLVDIVVSDGWLSIVTTLMVVVVPISDYLLDGLRV